jgi:hypothetical protein
LGSQVPHPLCLSKFSDGLISREQVWIDSGVIVAKLTSA